MSYYKNQVIFIHKILIWILGSSDRFLDFGRLSMMLYIFTVLGMGI